jgi:hypothetical protein
VAPPPKLDEVQALTKHAIASAARLADMRRRERWVGARLPPGHAPRAFDRTAVGVAKKVSIIGAGYASTV